jgi:hypothetical protein
LKPVLDGKRIANVLGMKPGPQMGHLIQQLMEWQVGTGDVSEEEAIHWVKSHFINLQILNKLNLVIFSKCFFSFLSCK